MKSLIILLSMLVVTVSSSLAWEPLPCGTTTTLYGVAFADAGIGWAVGAGGTIRHTTDGGASWVGQASGTSFNLYGVSFADANRGWVSAANDAILRTTNSGSTWTSISYGSNALFGIASTDTNNVWAVGNGADILHSANGWTPWILQYNIPGQRLNGVAFANASNGWTVGANGLILHTTNGGNAWAGQSSGTTASLYGVAFVDINTGWTVGAGGTIRHTTDGGATWTGQASGTTAGLYAVSFADANSGWAVGANGTILNTLNGGNTWVSESSGTSVTLRGLAIVDTGHIWVVGDGGTVLRNSTPQPESDLVAYYPFTGNANDSSGNGLHGVVHGATLTEDRFGNPNSAYHFDGEISYIEVADNNLLDTESGEDLTLCIWTRTTASDTMFVLTKYNSYGYGGSVGGFHLSSSTHASLAGRDRLGYRFSGQSCDIVNDNQWHFLVGMRSGSIWSIWVDGVMTSASDAGNTTAMSTIDNLLIGAYRDGGYPIWWRFNGDLDDIRIYNRALSAMEIQELYGVPQNPSALRGAISGVLTASSSPYYVECDVNVPDGQRLTIEPGVEIKFTGHYKFNVFGNLQAIGTAEDSIIFTRAYPTEGSKWWGIRFLSADDTSRLSYCVVEYGLAAGHRSGPTDPNWHGGGIWANYSKLEIQHSSIRNNHAEDDGGGMAMQHSPYARISHCTFSDNSCRDIPGFLATGGLDLSVNNGDIQVDHCVFAHNHSYDDAGALLLYYNSGVVVINCSFVANTSVGYGPAVRCYGGHHTLRNCIFWSNAGLGGQVYVTNGTMTIEHSDVQGGYSGVGNINADPLFVDVSARDYHLTANSPCIDTGDPNSPLDPDGTRNDMGAFPFYHIPSGEISGTVSGGYAGIIVELLLNGVVVDFVQVDSSGDYSFANVAPAAYDVHVMVPQYYGIDANPKRADLTPGEVVDVDFTLTPLPGVISGTILPPYGGVIIDLANQSGLLLSSVLTNAAGTYTFPNLAVGSYYVDLVEPLGFAVNRNHVPAVVNPGGTTTVDFVLAPLIVANNARSHGYWKHQVKANISGRGQTDFTADELTDLAQDIFNAFYLNPLYPVEVADVTFVGDPPGPLGLSHLNTMLNINQGGSTMHQRASMQYLALLLNVISGYLAQYAPASADNATVSQAIIYIDEILPANPELAKNIAETLNLAMTVGSGVIPLTTPNILFSDASNFSPPQPNPFNPVTNLSFELQQAMQVKLVVYDVLGRTVAVLADGWHQAGRHRVIFDGSQLASGMYFAHFQAGRYTKVHKMMLLK